MKPETLPPSDLDLLLAEAGAPRFTRPGEDGAPATPLGEEVPPPASSDDFDARILAGLVSP